MPNAIRLKFHEKQEKFIRNSVETTSFQKPAILGVQTRKTNDTMYNLTIGYSTQINTHIKWSIPDLKQTAKYYR